VSTPPTGAGLLALMIAQLRIATEKPSHLRTSGCELLPRDSFRDDWRPSISDRRLPCLSFARTTPVHQCSSVRSEAAMVGGGDHVPKAIALIAGSGLGSEVLNAARQAFDNAWAEVAGKFYGATQKEAAQLILATAILAVATSENHDVETLKQVGLQALARK
jgi:hypothetical protein